MLEIQCKRVLGFVATFALGVVVVSRVDAQTVRRIATQPKVAAKLPAKAPTSSSPLRKPDESNLDDLSKRLTPEEMKAAMLVECIQPDYRAWERITVGMPVQKVREILGEPLTERPPLPVFGPNEQSEGALDYGRIAFESPSMRQQFDFTLLALDGKVNSKSDPFNAPLAKAAKPSTPVLATPAEGVKLHHFPRFLDFRWYPSSGEYPISYTVEVQYGHDAVARNPQTKRLQASVGYDMELFLETKIPYVAFSFGGSQPGRWRVKAKNRHGESAWTEWRTFDFSDVK